MSTQTKIIDNKSLGNVINEIKNGIKNGSDVAIISTFFSIFAFDAVKKELNAADNVKLLLPHRKADDFYKQMIGSELDRALRNKLNITKIAKDCANWLDKKCYLKELPAPIGQNLYFIENTDENNVGIIGSSPFTTEGLGVVATSSHHMNTCFYGKEETESLEEWFGGLWSAGTNSDLIKKNLLEYLRLIYADKTAQQIYFLTLYNIFKDLISDLQVPA
jgi:hypothetical protein